MEQKIFGESGTRLLTHTAFHCQYFVTVCQYLNRPVAELLTLKSSLICFVSYGIFHICTNSCLGQNLCTDCSILWI